MCTDYKVMTLYRSTCNGNFQRVQESIMYHFPVLTSLYRSEVRTAIDLNKQCLPSIRLQLHIQKDPVRIVKAMELVY